MGELCAAIIGGATWSIAWFICYIFYFTPHRANWKQILGPTSVVFVVISLAQFLGSELGRGDNIWWGYIAAEIILLPFFLFCLVNGFTPIGSFYPRPVLRYWAAYLVTLHALYLTTYILIEKDSEAQYCIAITQDIIFSATFALVIYFVLRQDGKYLAEETAPILDLYRDGTLNMIPWDELEIERDIKGAGSQGTVYKARWGSELVAVKKITLPPMGPSDGMNFGSGNGKRYGLSSASAADHEEAIQALSREANYLVELRHPSIVQFYGITRVPEGKDVFGLVTKYMEHNLFSVIQEQVISQATPISWPTRLKWVRNIAFGLRYLHSKSINHGDIKSMNTLLSADLQSCQLCDFGSAGRAATATLHTPQWSAPEVLQGGVYTRKSDVYSFGVLIWEIVTFHHPYERKSLLEAQKLIKDGQSPLVLWPDLIPHDTPEVLMQLMQATMRKSPSQRPSMENVCTALASPASMESGWAVLSAKPDDFELDESSDGENRPLNGGVQLDES